MARCGRLQRLAFYAGGSAWLRHRRGRPRTRWEEPLIKVAGLAWLVDLGSGRAEAIAQHIAENAQVATAQAGGID